MRTEHAEQNGQYFKIMTDDKSALVSVMAHEWQNRWQASAKANATYYDYLILIKLIRGIVPPYDDIKLGQHWLR